jgi:hypothetical protein
MAEAIHEILPGVVHWTSKHPNIGIEVSSYYLVEERILLDPLAPDEGLEFFDGREPREILLTNRHHTRSAFELQDRWSIPIRAPQTGMHDLPSDRVEPYDFGEELSEGIRPYAIAEEWPDETALHIPGHRAVAIADGVVNYDGLAYVPDQYMDDPEQEKRSLANGFIDVVEQVDFDHLLLAHGAPVIGDGRDQLKAFAASHWG